MSNWSADVLAALGLPVDDTDLGTSRAEFEGGGSYRVEIPSVETPDALAAVVEEAKRLEVSIHRASQGSGVMLLTNDELKDMAQIGAETSIEVCLFIGPRAPWEAGAAALTPEGGQVGWRHSGMRQLSYALREAHRATDAGIRSLLVADEGLIWILDQARRRGDLPADLILKGSASLGLSNPVQVKLLEAAGLDTANIMSDTTIERLATMRSVVGIPLDLYVESPDGLGGFLRYHEIGDIVRVAAPVHLKFGLRNSPGLYPAGQQLPTLVSSARERVRRARIGLEHLERLNPDARPSAAGPRRGVPCPN